MHNLLVQVDNFLLGSILRWIIVGGACAFIFQNIEGHFSKRPLFLQAVIIFSVSLIVMLLLFLLLGDFFTTVAILSFGSGVIILLFSKAIYIKISNNSSQIKKSKIKLPTTNSAM